MAVAVAANAASGLLETSSPRLAGTLNPLNTDAKVNALTGALSTPVLPKLQLNELQRDAAALVRLSPGDARAYSLLAQTFKLQENQAEARRLFQIALRVAPTEINSLLNRLEGSAAEGALNETIERLDVILRRWPEHFDTIKPVIDAMAAHPAGSVLLNQRLAAKPPWRWRVLLQLKETDPGLKLARQLLVNEASSGKPVRRPEAAEVIIQLLKQKSPAEAYRTFLLTLDEQERETLGFVFNSKFELKPDYRMFNWRVVQKAEAAIRLPLRVGGKNKGALSVRFRGTPAKLGNVYQVLQLPRGRYRLGGFATARGLVAPKGLFWELYCYYTGERLAEAQIEPGTYKLKPFADDITVPTANCQAQLLRLRTGVETPTWQARYRGSVIIDEISVVKQP